MTTIGVEATATILGVCFFFLLHFLISYKWVYCMGASLTHSLFHSMFVLFLKWCVPLFFPRNLFHSVFFHFVRLSLIVLYGASCALERFFSHSIYRFISLVILFFIWNVIVVDLSKNPTKKCFAFFLSDKYKKAHNVRMLYVIVRKKRSGIVNWFREFRPHSMQFSQCNRNLYSLRSLENMLNRRNSFWNVLHSLQELVCISHAAHGYWYFFLFFPLALSLSRPSLKINVNLSVKMAALFSWFYKNRRVQFSTIFEQQEKR